MGFSTSDSNIYGELRPLRSKKHVTATRGLSRSALLALRVAWRSAAETHLLRGSCLASGTVKKHPRRRCKLLTATAGRCGTSGRLVLINTVLIQRRHSCRDPAAVP